MKTRKNTKGKNYEILFERAEKAIEKGFFLETSWVIYSIIEDRLLSLLRSSGGIPNPERGKFLMAGEKLRVLNKRLAMDSNLQKVLYGDIMKDVKAWLETRNKFMHRLADSIEPVSRLEPAIEDLAIKGQIVAKKLSARAMKLKKII